VGGSVFISCLQLDRDFGCIWLAFRFLEVKDHTFLAAVLSLLLGLGHEYVKEIKVVAMF
jgi:hypothetical protein